MFRYRLHTVDGDELGEAAYAMQIRVDDVVHVGTKPYRVVAVVDFTEEDDSPLEGLLQVEPVA